MKAHLHEAIAIWICDQAFDAWLEMTNGEGSPLEISERTVDWLLDAEVDLHRWLSNLADGCYDGAGVGCGGKIEPISGEEWIGIGGDHVVPFPETRSPSKQFDRRCHGPHYILSLQQYVEMLEEVFARVKKMEPAYVSPEDILQAAERR